MPFALSQISGGASQARELRAPAQENGGEEFRARKVGYGESIYSKWLIEAGVDPAKHAEVLNRLLGQNIEIELLLDNKTVKKKSKNLERVEEHQTQFSGQKTVSEPELMVDVLLRLSVQESEIQIGGNPSVVVASDGRNSRRNERRSLDSEAGAEEVDSERLIQRFENVCSVPLPGGASYSSVVDLNHDEASTDDWAWIGEFRRQLAEPGDDEVGSKPQSPKNDLEDLKRRLEKL